MNYTDKEKYGPNCIGQVIRIVDETELIINVSEYDITVGDKIVVYALGDTIKDLDGTELGKYECDKATLTVVTTTENYSICKSEVIMKKSAIVVASDIFSSTYEGYKTLKVNKEQMKKIEIKNKDVIQLGDLVKKG